MTFPVQYAILILLLPSSPGFAQPPDSTGMQLLHSALGHRNSGQYTLSMEEDMRALHIFQHTGYKVGIAAANTETAQLYQYMGEQNGSREYVRQGLEYARTGLDQNIANGDTASVVLSRNVQGIIYRSMALVDRPFWYDSAMACYLDALARITPSGKGRKYTGMLYNNISQVYSEYKKDYPAALHYLQMAVNFNIAENRLASLSFNYGNISAVYAKMGDKHNSLEYAYKTLQQARILGTANRLMNAYQQLYDSYDHFGKADSALRYYLLFDHLKDSMASLATNRQIAEAQAKYEAEKNKAVIADLNNRNSLQRKRIVVLVVGLSGVLLFSAGLFAFYKRVQRQKQLISTQSGQLEVMMKELHHRVKNNLQIISSLLSLQSYKLKDEEAVEAIRLSQQRVQAMSFIHQRLYSTEQTRMVDMQEYLRDLTHSLVAAYGYNDETLVLHLQITRKWLDVDKALPLGLIANEITTNALKYAFEDSSHPALSVSLNEDEGQLRFTVKDNGRGWDIRKWEQPGASFGRQLVDTLCRQLKAARQLTYENGSVFSFLIPLQQS
jgi:two-component sensor histidine kinase